MKTKTDTEVDALDEQIEKFRAEHASLTAKDSIRIKDMLAKRERLHARQHAQTMARIARMKK